MQRGHSLHKVCLVTAIDRESDTLIRVSNLGVPPPPDPVIVYAGLLESRRR